jgi:hypothetical protein
MFGLPDPVSVAILAVILVPDLILATEPAFLGPMCLVGSQNGETIGLNVLGDLCKVSVYTATHWYPVDFEVFSVYITHLDTLAL